MLFLIKTLLLINLCIAQNTPDDNPKGDDNLVTNNRQGLDDNGNRQNVRSGVFLTNYTDDSSNSRSRDDTSHSENSIFDTFVFTGITFGALIFQ